MPSITLGPLVLNKLREEIVDRDLLIGFWDHLEKVVDSPATLTRPSVAPFRTDRLQSGCTLTNTEGERFSFSILLLRNPNEAGIHVTSFTFGPYVELDYLEDDFED